ncbi:hypothetical protein F5Y11DRAFT_200038 [Daldinia sp. FL1419]|nr:hypothetical protein F5Y11DRAFT_200038 [Daldinia sp. FL1419]
MIMSSLQPKEINQRFIDDNIVSGVFLLLAFVSVILRFVHQQRKNIIGWGDWVILIAFITGVGAYVSGFLCALTGYRDDNYTTSQLDACAKTDLAGEILYTFSVGSSKTSVLLLYKWIFAVHTQFILLIDGMIILVVAVCITYTFGLIFADSPAEAQWDTTIPHTSINTVAFYVTMGSINILIDIAVIGLVQWRIWQLHMSKKRKIEISILLLFAVMYVLGSFYLPLHVPIAHLANLFRSTVFGIMRVVYTGINDRNTLTLAWLWANLELFSYIICACLPVVYNLFRATTHRRSENESASTRAIRCPTETFDSSLLEEDGNGYLGPGQEMYDFKQYGALKAQRQYLKETQSIEQSVRLEPVLIHEKAYDSIGRFSWPPTAEEDRRRQELEGESERYKQQPRIPLRGHCKY